MALTIPKGASAPYYIASIEEYGAHPDNSAADNVTAINAAISAFNNGDVDALIAGPGTFNINAALTTVTRNGFSLRGAGARTTLFQQTASTDGFSFSSATPNTTAIFDITLADFGYNQSASNPTAGIAFNFYRAKRTNLNSIDIRNVFQGINFQGGGDIRVNGSTVTGSSTWSATATGSYLVRIAQHSGSLEIPSEMYFNNFNWNASVASFGASTYLDSCMLLEAGDGMFFSNGHMGGAYTQVAYVNPQAVASASIYNLEFSNVYFDGFGSGLDSGRLVKISGSATPVVDNIHFKGCVFRNGGGGGLSSSVSQLIGLTVNDCSFFNNDLDAITISAGAVVTISNSQFRSNNESNTSNNCINITGGSRMVVTGNSIGTGSSTHPVGLSVGASAAHVSVTNNIFDGHTTDLTHGTSGVISGNYAVSGISVASASPLVVPAVHDVISVTGTTGFSAISATVPTGRKLTLVFAGALTVTDSGTLLLAGSSSMTTTAGAVLNLIWNGAVWCEQSRSVN